MGHKVSEIRLCKTLSKEIAQTTQRVENEDAYAGSEANIEWGFLDGALLERLRVVMLRDATISLIRTVTKLCVRGSKDLLGRRRRMWVHETIVIIILIEDGVF